jgi:hypothetical protein
LMIIDSDAVLSRAEKLVGFEMVLS